MQRHQARLTRDEYDTIVVGSGFGGASAALALCRAGERVLMVERGRWVPRGPAAWRPEATSELTPFYWRGAPYVHRSGRRVRELGSYACAGGASVFYGGVSMRLRPEDFSSPVALRAAGADWPVGYDALEPHYTEAERLLDVAGDATADPCGPPRSAPLPQGPMRLSPVAERIGAAAEGLGLRPFGLPLAFNLRAGGGRAACIGCGTCDTFACAISAKNDVATAVLPRLLDAGLELRTGTVVQRLLVHGDRVTGVRVLDLDEGRVRHLHAKRVVLAAGALASAHLVLASGLASRSPDPDLVGRFLTRHCSAIVYGVFARRLEDRPRFHKQLGIHDAYHGDPAAPVSGPLGSLQQMPTPPAALVEHHVRGAVGRALRPVVPHLTGLLAMAADQPDPANRVVIDPRHGDRFGLPRLVIEHRHTPRDLAARDHLVGMARRVLTAAGAVGAYVLPIETFSHAAGTLRMSADDAGSVLDADGRFRGVDGLWVSDASALPSVGAVNPSLTIAANALRVGAAMTARTGVEADVAAA